MIVINGQDLKLEEFIKITRENEEITLSEDAVKRVVASREYTDNLVEEGKVVYGVTTGFGKFSDVLIEEEQTPELQRNLIMSHSCGVGEPLDIDLARGVMVLRINALAKGYSGIRLSTLNTLIEMVNKGVTPVIPEKGSLGASGDLAPLAHMVLVMIGEGEAFYNGIRMSGSEAMEKANIKVVELISKEGLALINGTQVMTSVGAHALYDAINLSKLSDIVSSLTMQALNGIEDAFDLDVSLVRPHSGQLKTSENMLKLINGSKMTTRQGDIRVQDAYSIRCLPQILGASKDCFSYVLDKVEIEMNSVTDNPIIFKDKDKVISGGNFHGQPMALAFDFLAIGLSELANISERRLERLVNPALNGGLPAFLTENGGMNSGFMIVQYAAASLVSENKVLAHPASVDSIPSSANQEDHVSMGTIAARKSYEISKNVTHVLTMELLAACQAIDLRGNRGLGKGSEVAYNIVREKISKVDFDRIMYKDINKCEEIVKTNEIVEEVEKIIGKL